MEIEASYESTNSHGAGVANARMNDWFLTNAAAADLYPEWTVARRSSEFVLSTQVLTRPDRTPVLSTRPHVARPETTVDSYQSTSPCVDNGLALIVFALVDSVSPLRVVRYNIFLYTLENALATCGIDKE
ncbi:hypothetical protein J6590_002083 [Homalodisca vitripennis]|nr:hypothetical protein J6590_002083 [Homalodisca vitripennis]